MKVEAIAMLISSWTVAIGWADSKFLETAWTTSMQAVAVLRNYKDA